MTRETRNLLYCVIALLIGAAVYICLIRTNRPALEQRSTPRTATTYTPLIPPVVGDGVTDDTVAFQNFVNGLPNFSKVTFPFGMKILMTQPLLIGNKMGLSFFSEAGGGGPSANGMAQSGTAIGWKMTTAGQPMVELYGSRSCTFDGLSFIAMPGGANPSVGIDIDLPTGFKGYPVTDNTIKNGSVIGPAADCGFVGIRNSWVVRTNCDYLTIDHVSIQVSQVSGQTGVRTGVAFLQGNSYNAKQIVLNNVQMGYAAYGIWMTRGTMFAQNISGEYCDTCIRIDLTAGPSTFIGGGAGFEYPKCFVQIGSNGDGTGDPIIFQGFRVASLYGPAVLRVNPGCSYVTFTGNSISQIAPGTAQLFDPTMMAANYWGSSVRSSNNNWGVPSPNKHDYVNYHDDVSDVYSHN